jgi:hypothetical protein
MQQVAGVESKNVCVLTVDETGIQMNQGFIFARIPELKINGPKNGASLRNFGMKRDDVYILSGITRHSVGAMNASHQLAARAIFN